MYSTLSERGVRVPNGFCTTAAAFRLFIDEADLTDKISSALDNPAIGKDSRVLAETGKEIREWILAAQLPAPIVAELRRAYDELKAERPGDETAVAVRSSATAEDLPNASFAGQQETYLNIEGIDALIITVRRVMARPF